ncbi:AcrR family transcriptional regulator [Microbacterium resistens]|uniref:AcrR family transcriptional regulator n=1 Tax=Microbacterium resistens TaxID=156977 RepID=A0ABU1S9E7_9MICO|nr:TetR/AcrR family transcriptional regulator [Microbacterium resistens]MDR6866237.1 AcrR family transcriptional regulator [Microbacterium resistens]
MPRSIDHDRRRREIVDVATRIILKGGFEAATMRSIAAEAGFANGALKHYFPGKESIVAATFETMLARISEGVAPPDAASTTAEGALRGFLEATIPRDTEQIAAGRVLLALWEHAMSHDALAELYRGHLRSWRSSLIERMEAARDEGAVPEQDFEAMADEYITAAVGATVVNLMYPDGERIAGYRSYIDRFLARLRGAVLAAPGDRREVSGR